MVDGRNLISFFFEIVLTFELRNNADKNAEYNATALLAFHTRSKNSRAIYYNNNNNPLETIRFSFYEKY